MEESAAWSQLLPLNDLYKKILILSVSPPAASCCGCQVFSCWLICLAASGAAGSNGATWLAWLHSNLRPNMIWSCCCVCRLWLTPYTCLLLTQTHKHTRMHTRMHTDCILSSVVAELPGHKVLNAACFLTFVLSLWACSPVWEVAAAC